MSTIGTYLDYQSKLIDAVMRSKFPRKKIEHLTTDEENILMEEIDKLEAIIEEKITVNANK